MLQSSTEEHACSRAPTSYAHTCVTEPWPYTHHTRLNVCINTSQNDLPCIAESSLAPADATPISLLVLLYVNATSADPTDSGRLYVSLAAVPAPPTAGAIDNMNLTISYDPRDPVMHLDGTEIKDSISAPQQRTASTAAQEYPVMPAGQ